MRSTAMRWNFREYRFRLSTHVSSPGKCAHRKCANSRGHSTGPHSSAQSRKNYCPKPPSDNVLGELQSRFCLRTHDPDIRGLDESDGYFTEP
jgi:hypothetical protein